MNLFPAISLTRMLVTAGIILAIAGFGARLEHNRMQKKLDKAVAEHNQFKGGVAALGRAAEIEVAKRTLADMKAKERADEESKRRDAATRATIAGLRADADSARRGLLQARPANSECPEALVCFDADAFERANGERREAVRRLADEGTQVETDLDVAREWANE